jgi:hypothetical protein
MMEKMAILDNITYISPISGIDFVKYVMFYSKLACTPIRPKRIICASGGCMVSNMARMSDFSTNVEKWRITSGMFAYKPLPIPRLFYLLVTGSLYKRPNIDEFIITNFIPSKLRLTEIITGSYSTKQGRVVLSTNFDSQRSELNETNFDLTAVSVEHNDYDLVKVLRSIEATTNIPFLLPPLGDEKLVDYGIHSPSPLTFIRGRNSMNSGNNNSLLNQVVYMSPINVEKTYHEDTRTLMYMNTIHTEISRLTSDFSTYETFTDYSFLEKVPLDNTRFLLLIYTTYEIELTIVDFKPEDVFVSLERMRNLVKYRLYTQ